MAVNIGGIYFSVEADTKNAHLNIKNIQESVKTLADTGAAKLSNLTTAFKSLENASLTLSEKLARNTKFASNTFDGLNARVAKLQSLLNKSAFGSERFKKLSAAIEETKGKLDAANNSGSKLQGLFTALGSGIAAMGITSLGKEVLKTSGTFEKYNAVLKNALGTQQKAAAAMEMIKKFAAETPFSVDELTASFIKFTNRGLNVTEQELRAFGDTAASQGKSFDQYTEAVLDALSGETERLKEFGIQAAKAGDMISFTFKGITQTVKQTPQEISKALQAIGQMEGVAGGMAAVSKTLTGNVSNLGDTFDALKLSIGDALLEPAKSIVQAINSIINSINSFAKANPALWNTLIKTTALIAGLALAFVGGNGIVTALRTFGTVLSAQAAGAALKWAAILGPFALGATALVFTITYLEERKAANQAASNATRQGRVTEFATKEIDAAIEKYKTLDKSIKTTEQSSKALSKTLDSVSTLIIDNTNGYAASIQSIESAAAAAAGLGLSKLSAELLMNKNNATLAKEAIDLYKTKLKEVDSERKKAREETGKSGKSGKKDTPLPSTEEKKSSNLDFGETFAEVNALSEKVKAFDEAISKTTGKLERLGLQVGKYAMIGQELIKSVGSRVLNLMGAQAQLASVKFDNLKQKLSFLSQASDKMIDDSLKNTINAINAETNLRLAEYENQLKALDDQKQAELQIEKDFQAEMKALKIQLDAESKAESERRFNEAWAVRQLEYERQLEFIAANTSDQTQLAISQQTLLNQQEQDKIALRQAIDQQLQDSLAVNQETIQAKEQTFAQQQLAAADAEAKKREAIEVKKTALLAEQENKRQQAQDRADQQKMQSQKAIRLFEWASGRAAFEMNKRQQAAQIQMQMASIVMSAIQAMAGFTAATLGFGVIAGMALAATITGLGLATGMTSLAAVNSAQYPPPPIFEKGGMVGGVSHSMGGTMIEAEAGEFVVNKNSAAANMDMLQAINSGKSMGGGTTIYYAGVQIGTIQTNNPDEIYNMVEPRIRQEIYQAVSR